MLNLLLTLLVLVLALSVCFWLVSQLPAEWVPAPAQQIARAIIVIIGLILVLGLLFGGGSVPRLRL